MPFSIRGKRGTYRGAGILFFTRTPAGISVLLGERQHSGVWSIPGGGSDPADADLHATAFRETTEEFGAIPVAHRHRFTLSYPFGFFGFGWRTLVVELPGQPDGGEFPDRHARDFHEFRDAAWFPLRKLPPKTHWLLCPALIGLRLGSVGHPWVLKR